VIKVIGMPRNCFDCVFYSLNAELTGQINPFLRMCFKYEFCNAVAKVEQLLEKSDQNNYVLG